MREAVGGTLLLQIVLVFLVVYIGFMAIILNYGTVFRTKNKIINYIEQYEGVKNVSELTDVARRRFDYHGDIDACYTAVENRGYYYKVKIYINFQFSIFFDLKIPVSGETRLIDSGELIPDRGWEC